MTLNADSGGRYEYGPIPFGHGSYTCPDPTKPRSGVVVADPLLAQKSLDALAPIGRLVAG